MGRCTATKKALPSLHNGDYIAATTVVLIVKDAGTDLRMEPERPPHNGIGGPAVYATVIAGSGIARPVGTAPTELVDPFGRAISYLRVSVTDRCDFRCVYCMSENMAFLPKADLLSLEELDRLCSAFIARGVRKLRLTGGEPLVRRGIMTLFGSLSPPFKGGGVGETPPTHN